MVQGAFFKGPTLSVSPYTLNLHLAKGETFHFSFLSFFRLYVRLFLNSFGIQASLLPVRSNLTDNASSADHIRALQGSRTTPTLGPLTSCYTSALDSLRIVSDDFVKMSMLVSGTEKETSYDNFSDTDIVPYSAIRKTQSL